MRSNFQVDGGLSSLLEMVYCADVDLLTSFLGSSEGNRTVEVRQYTTMSSYPGGRRLLTDMNIIQASPSPPPTPAPPPQHCTVSSELTFYLTFPADLEDVRLNQVGYLRDILSRLRRSCYSA